MSDVLENKSMDGQQTDRNRIIIKTSIIGIIANILLAGFKAVIGIVSNSIAVVLDAVNNLSDALSSVITIIGTKLAGKKPDKKHPLGYGRIEYLSAMIVSAIVLYAGITSLVESVKKIINPETADYSYISLIIIAVAVVVKLILGRYVKNVGEKVSSGSLVASGSDALFDAIISSSVLLSAILYLITKVSLEAYVGVIISIVIIKAGIEMMLETLDEILGRRADRDYVNEIKKTICEDESVWGAYDLIIHNYGPERNVASVHVEVPDTMTADELDEMQRRIACNVFKKHGVMLTGIGIYSMNTTDDEVKEMRSRITKIVMSHDGILQMHGFYVDMKKKVVNFDVILDFEVEDRRELYETIRQEVSQAYPEFAFMTTMDIDI